MNAMFTAKEVKKLLLMIKEGKHLGSTKRKYGATEKKYTKAKKNKDKE